MGQGESSFYSLFFIDADRCLLEDCPYVGMPGLLAGPGKMPSWGSRADSLETDVVFTLREVPLVCMQRSSCRQYVTHLFGGRDFS